MSLPSRECIPGGHAATDRPRQIILDTLGKLRAYSHGLWGWCYNCAGLFGVDVPALVDERGADCDIARLAPVQCPYCGSSAVEMHIIDLGKGGRGHDRPDR